VRKEVSLLAVPLGRNEGLVPQRVQPGEPKTEKSGLRLEEEVFSILLESDPSMALARIPYSARDKACFVSHLKKLTPSIHGKIVAVAFARSLKFFGWHPVVLFSELFLVGNCPTATQELAEIFQRFALDTQRMRYVSSYWERGGESAVMFFIRPKSGSPFGVVALGKKFSNQGLKTT
jgi:hypothetical protein